MEHFLSCDWGTTSFRIRLVQIKDGHIIAEEKSAYGIAETFNLWQETGNADQEKKVGFYLAIINHHIKKIEEKLSKPLNGVKLIISGMASSSMGIIDIPYAIVPIALDGTGVKTALRSANKYFDHDVLMISGVRANDDVMRGEETQLIGCIDHGKHHAKNEIYIFPGTHSKHITIKGNQVAGIKTYMTGEIFELLSQKSILKNGIEANKQPGDFSSFKDGVKEAMSQNLLHSVFKVRTNHLFNLYTKKENFNFLSGLLIGTELNDLKKTRADTINLVGGTDLEIYYQTALKEIGISKTVNSFSALWANEATVRGQLKIGRQLKILA